MRDLLYFVSVIFLASSTVIPSGLVVGKPTEILGTAISNTQDTGSSINAGASASRTESAGQRPNAEYCLDWNGFQSNYCQILELRNRDSSVLALRVDLRDREGDVSDSLLFSLTPLQKRDIVLNSLHGFIGDSHGLVCATVITGNARTLDIQLSVHDLTTSSFGFAYTVNYSPGETGEQYLSYNHSFPSWDSEGSYNLVESYVQVANEEARAECGVLIFYEMEGIELGREAVSVAPRGRVDVDSHRLGVAAAGLVAWKPHFLDKKFRVLLNRYYYDNSHNILGAVSLIAKQSSTAKLSATFSTISKVTVAEINNTLNSPINVAATVFDSSGSRIGAQPKSVSIPAKGARHVVLNTFLSNSAGTIQLEASQNNAIIVNTMEYGVTTDYGFLFANNGEAKAGTACAERSLDKSSPNNYHPPVNSALPSELAF